MSMAPVAHDIQLNNGIHHQSPLKIHHRHHHHHHHNSNNSTHHGAHQHQHHDIDVLQQQSMQGRQKTLELATAVMKKRVGGLDIATCDWRETLPFLVGDIGEIYRQHLRWKVNLPRVKPHYAVKCNPEPNVLRLLAELGTGFDCASMQEIETVLSLGVDPSRIVFAHPRKDVAQARKALSSGIGLMTCDSEQDLVNASEYFPQAELLVRIATDDSASKCRLGYKFGACDPFDTPEELLRTAKSLGLNIVGVSFHIGSDASDPQAYTAAVREARAVFDQASLLGYDLRVLDVGGGFTNPLFERMATALNRALDEHFPPSVRIIGEPGRFYVGSAFLLACQVTGRRKVKHPGPLEPDYHLDINEGVYGTLANIVSDHQERDPKILLRRAATAAKNGSMASSTDNNNNDNNNNAMLSPSLSPTLAPHATRYLVWGPTCDSFDRPMQHLCTLPGLVNYGDWLYIEDMGAYTLPCATEFNGNPKARVVYVSSEPGAAALLNNAF